MRRKQVKRRVIRRPRGASARPVSVPLSRGELPGIPESLKSRLRKIEALVVLDLGGVNLADEHVDATGVDHIAIGGATLRRIVFENIRGSVFIDSGLSSTECSHLQFTNCVVDRFTTKGVTFADCRFIDVTFEELFADDSTLSTCIFSGAIHKGIFSAKPATSPGATTLPAFEGNDFTACELGDVDFRGGIDLLKQRFGSDQRRLIVDDGPRMLDELNRYLKVCNNSVGARRLRDFFQRSVHDYRQRQVFISLPFAKNFLCGYLMELGKDRSLVSAEFAAWASDIEKSCANFATDNVKRFRNRSTPTPTSQR
jgi:hypothetical protein